MADKKLTPMMELFNDIEKHIQFTGKYKANFLEKERQNYIDAYRRGSEFGFDATKKEAEQYYNEKFKTE